MKFAVIKTGGKQYLVEKGAKVKVEKLIGEKDSKVILPEVLLICDDKGKECTPGKPIVKGAEVHGKVLRQGRRKKVTVVKYKNKTRYKRTLGHKQAFTEIEITDIKEKKG